MMSPPGGPAPVIERAGPYAKLLKRNNLCSQFVRKLNLFLASFITGASGETINFDNRL